MGKEFFAHTADMNDRAEEFAVEQMLDELGQEDEVVFRAMRIVGDSERAGNNLGTLWRNTLNGWIEPVDTDI